MFQLTFLVEQEQVLREFLAAQDISKRTLTAVKYQGGKIFVNGVEKDVRHLLQGGDEVRVIFPPEKPSEGLAIEEGALTILYEDEAILLVEKPAGQSTIPSAHHHSGTLANVVAGKFAKEQIPATVHIVTRLDFDTSGLICIAKNRHIHHLLSRRLNESSFERTYEAIVEGHISNDYMIIDQPIGRKEDSIIERVVRSDGQKAVTHIQVIERFEIAKQPFTHVRLKLETGRTHQIRVHMKWLGYPLHGDDLYGGEQTYLSRQALHCRMLSFQHPIDKKDYRFTSPLAKDMQKMLNQKK